MNSVKIWTGTLFGAGLLPYGPGTWGSLVSLPVIYFTAIYFPVYGLYLLAAVTIALSLWATPANEQRYGEDPPQFVIDEAAGQTVTFLAVSFHYSFTQDVVILAIGFFLFRIFDILKPLGINKLQSLRGKYGVLFDDLLAGLYALIILEILHKVLPTFF